MTLHYYLDGHYLLCKAVMQGDIAAVNNHLSCLDPESFARDRWELSNALLIAVQTHKVGIALLLLQRGADPNLRIPDGTERTPLHYAVQHKDMKMMRALLCARANPNRRSLYGSAPLHVISCKEAAEALLQARANPLIVDRGGYTSSDVAKLRFGAASEMYQLLFTAEKRQMGHLLEAEERCLPAALGQIVFEYVKGEMVLETPGELFAAIDLGNLAEVASRVDALHPQILRPPKGRRVHNPLHQAATRGNEAIVEFLLSEKKADPDVQNPEGYTALRLAIRHGHSQVVERLLQAGANPHLAGDEGRTPLHEAIVQDRLQLARRLLQLNADPNAQNRDGSTPFHLAALRGEEEVVQLLFAFGANLSLRDASGTTPFEVALITRHYRLIQWFLRQGLDVAALNNPDLAMRTLRFAVRQGDREMVEQLVRSGICVNGQEYYGQTPLHWAAVDNDLEMFAFLLRRGADPTLRNQASFTVLEVIRKLWGPRQSKIYEVILRTHRQLVAKRLQEVDIFPPELNRLVVQFTFGEAQ